MIFNFFVPNTFTKADLAVSKLFIITDLIDHHIFSIILTSLNWNTNNTTIRDEITSNPANIL
jgi:hypothetical protein